MPQSNTADTSLNLTRRSVLAAVAVAGVAPYTFISGARAQGGDKLRIGIIGAGGRGAANTGGVRGENIVALCDTNPDALNQAAGRFEEARLVSDWREIVGADDIDAVVISTADHHHALAGVAAMKAGKHVYSEKPLGHTSYEARMMREVYEEADGAIATQMGTQIHAGDNYRRVVEMIQGGAVGPVREAHVWCSRSIRSVDVDRLDEQPIPEGFDWNAWLGPAADRPYNTEYWRGGNLNWNRRWDFGNGVLGDMGSHLIDLPYWALDLNFPLTVESEGPEPDDVACPPWQQITWEHPARNGNANLDVPVKVVWYHGPEGMRRRAEYLQPMVGDDTKINDWGIGVAFVGDKGVLTADYGKWVLSPSADFAGYQPPEQTIPRSIGHHAEWLRAAKTGEKTTCNFTYSGRLIEHNLLGTAAHRAGGKLEWDHEAFRFTNSDAATAYLTKAYREGWSIDDFRQG